MDFIKEILPESVRSIPTHMDFDGQKRAERTFQIIIILFGVVGFCWGYICQQFSQTMYILFAGFTLSCILTLPPWPMYRKKPLNWQKPKKMDTKKLESETSNQQTSEKKSKKKK